MKSSLSEGPVTQLVNYYSWYYSYFLCHLLPLPLYIIN